MRRAALYVGWAVLIGVVGYAFFLIGSPSHNRNILKDKNTLTELSKLDCAIKKYYQQEGRLPASLTAIKEAWPESKNRGNAHCNDYCYLPTTTEMEAFDVYEYTPAQSSYNICANFNLSWPDLENNIPAYEKDDLSWAKNYKTGKSCFERILSPCKNKDAIK
jgi:hypothetical protein